MRTRVKICGITSHDALCAAVLAGADAVGFVMYPASSRYVTAELAARLVAATPAWVTTVGLFVNHKGDEVNTLARFCRFDLLQFNGDEDNGFCESFDRPFIKAVRVGDNTDVPGTISMFPGSRGILLDAQVSGQFGGTGRTFDWAKIPREVSGLMLAGGLTPDNVESAIAVAAPFGVDVSGGVESAPGTKDPALIEAFIRAVHRADGGDQK
jgi:phosphoribosylanthranilate isomerase